MRLARSQLAIICFLSAGIALLWGFPRFWYREARAAASIFWLREEQSIADFTFADVPVSESAEKFLAADHSLSGEFTSLSRRFIRVFSAKRFEEDPSEVGLFTHTPDACWSQIGWKIEPSDPQVIELAVEGLQIPFERRIFANRGHRELVYFCGLAGGRALPYRLDHDLSVAMKFQARERAEKSGAALRAVDAHFWSRLWDSFASRRELFGPKQFIRVSTPIEGADAAAADERLQTFLPQWLKASDFERERQSWREAKLAKQD